MSDAASRGPEGPQRLAIAFVVDRDDPEGGYVVGHGGRAFAARVANGNEAVMVAAAIATFPDDAALAEADRRLAERQTAEKMGFKVVKRSYRVDATPAQLTDHLIDIASVPGAQVSVDPKWLAARVARSHADDATKDVIRDAIDIATTPVAKHADQNGAGTLHGETSFDRAAGLDLAVARTLSTYERGGKLEPADRAAFDVVTAAAAWSRGNSHEDALHRYATGALDDKPSDASLRLAEEIHARAKASAEAHPVPRPDVEVTNGGHKVSDYGRVATAIGEWTAPGSPRAHSGEAALAIAFGSHTTPNTLKGLNPFIAGAIGRHVAVSGQSVVVAPDGSARAASAIARAALAEHPDANGPGPLTREHGLRWDRKGDLALALHAAAIATSTIADLNKEPHMSNDAQKKADRSFLTVTKGEVAKAISLGNEYPGNRDAVAAYPNPMVRATVAFSAAIEQDQWQVDKAGKASRTGEVKSGREALEALHESFGEKLYRNVSFSADKVTLLSESASADQVGDFAASVKKSEGRRNAASLNQEATAKMETKVDVFASKAEIDEARKALDGGTPAKTPTGIVLSRLATAIEQPQWAKGADGKFRETGMVMTGKQALDSLYEGFGKGQHRKVHLDAVKTEYGVDNLGGGMRETFAAVEKISQARNAEFQATRAAAQARPQVRSASAGR